VSHPVADGVSKDERLLQQSGGPATRLGAADPAIGLCRSANQCCGCSSIMGCLAALYYPHSIA
jgi:hypothetical protein